MLCIQEAAHFHIGFQLHSLFVIILTHCSPARPQLIWEACKVHLCDDLHHRLIHRLYIPKPTEEQVYDYDLYLISQDLRHQGQSLDRFNERPRPQIEWHHRKGNQLIADQRAYDQEELQRFVNAGLPTLNVKQRGLYDAVMESVQQDVGSPFLIHSPGGCEKIYLCKLIAAAVCASEKIVLYVASTGLASLLLPGGHTAHSYFKIPFNTHEDSVCNIKRGDPIHELLCQTSLIIWDEVPAQHCHIIECVDCSLHDMINHDHVFGGITILFGGDFRQTLPVVPHGSREQTVSATLGCSDLWHHLHIHHLHQNMRLGRDPECND